MERVLRRTCGTEGVADVVIVSVGGNEMKRNDCMGH